MRATFEQKTVNHESPSVKGSRPAHRIDYLSVDPTKQRDQVGHDATEGKWAGPYVMIQWVEGMEAIPSSKGREGLFPLHHGIGTLPLQTDGHTQLKTLPSHNLRMRTVTSRQHKSPFTSSDCDVAATSLPNLINCFGVALLHLATVTSLGNRFVSHSGAMSQRRRSR